MTEKNIKKSQNIQLKIIFVRYYKIFIIIGAALILFFSYFFILKPKYEQVGIGGNYNLKAVKEEVNKREIFLKDLAELISRYQQINTNDLSRINQALPQGKDIAGLLVQLQNLAENNGLLLASVSVSDPTEPMAGKNGKAEIQQLSVNLSLIGSQNNIYRQLKEFLDSLETNLRLFDVSAVYFTPGSPAFSVNLITYYLNSSN
ncbi:MAG TPA: type 4a pilus biogenesis protein PilO [Patescibacteria group bacterium]|nr:type 4a pilus biogenesis protein PilO [Patescibacteria group bacterium]